MKKYLLSLLAVAALVFTACNKDPQPNKPDKPDTPDDPEPEVPEYVQPITIDGDFADWAKLDASKVAVAKCASDTKDGYDAVKEIRVYADELYVFFYLEYNNDKIADILAGTTNPADPEHNELPIRLNLNTDGEFTSGYTSYSLDGYDFIVEGAVATDGAWSSFDGTLHQRIDGGWTELLAGGSGMCSGAGSGNKYEICLIREVFNAAAGSSTVPMPMGDEFQAGVRFYTAPWGELCNMPNSPVSDDNANGYGHLLNITTDSAE